MLRHGILQGDIDMRDQELAVGRMLLELVPQGVSRFLPLGIRNPKPRQEVRAFWSIPGHECGVRLVRDLAMGVVMFSVESAADALGATVFDTLARGTPCVSIETILHNESRFEEMPELVFMAALAVRHAPTDRVVAIVKRLLSAPSEHVRVTTLGAVMVLKGDELLAAVKAAAERDDLTPAGRHVFETSIHNLETNPALWDRDKPFSESEDVFGVRW